MNPVVEIYSRICDLDCDLEKFMDDLIKMFIFDIITSHISLRFNTQFGTYYKSHFLILKSEDNFLNLEEVERKKSTIFDIW